MDIHHYLPHLAVAWTAYFIAVISPGPATMALIGTSMHLGRAAGLSLAMGVLTGSFIWASLTALGLAALLTAYAGILTLLKILGGLYLLWLAYKSIRSAMRSDASQLAAFNEQNLTRRKLYLRGLGIHLTNPKAILAWISLLSLGLPPEAPRSVIGIYIAGCLLIGFVSFNGFALLFSSRPIQHGYRKARRYIEGAMGAFFAFAGIKMLMARI
jgi:threonine/homoserine/homoserine lactone efflux protein